MLDVAQGLNRSETTKLLFGTASALFDASIAAWAAKRFYDSVRPLQMIQCLYADQMVRAWEFLVKQHEERFNRRSSGTDIAACLARWRHGKGHTKAWASSTDLAGSHTRCEQSQHGFDLSLTFMKPESMPLTAQESTFVTPPFPGYVSGHSTFSAAAAEFLQLYFGSDSFQGPACSLREEGMSIYEPRLLKGQAGHVAGFTDIPNTVSRPSSVLSPPRVTVARQSTVLMSSVHTARDQTTLWQHLICMSMWCRARTARATLRPRIWSCAGAHSQRLQFRLEFRASWEASTPTQTMWTA